MFLKGLYIKMPRVTTLLCLTTLICFASGCSVFMTGGLGRVNPSGEVKEPVGSSLRLECILNRELKEIQPGHSESLIWMKNGKVLSKEMTKVIDNYTAELLIPNVTVEDSGIYICNFRPNGSKSRYVCHNDVKIGYPPLNVTDFSCQSRNWQYLLCTFTNPLNPLTPTYKLSQFLRPNLKTACNLTKKHEKLSTFQQYSCNITSEGNSNPTYQQSAEKYYFQLEATNDLGTNTANFEVDHFARVLPNVPDNFTVVNESSTVLQASWLPPNKMALFPPGLLYRLKYLSQWDPSRWQVILVKGPAHKFTRDSKQVNSVNHILTGLQPYTEYTFQIQCRSTITTDEELWSQLTQNLTVRTLPDVPARPPNVTAGSFQVRTALSSRVVHVFWQMIPNYQKNGRNFTYIVTATPAVSSVKGVVIHPENKTSNYAVFTKLDLDTSYLFTIYSANEVGRSDASYVSVESDLELPDVPERFTVIDYDHGLFELSWIAPKSKFQDVTHYTLFWCNNIKPHPFTCTGNISWITVDKSVTAHNLTLPDKQQYYQFAIAANTPTSSSGMVWATCSVPYNGTLNKIKKVSLIKTGSSTLKVQWKLDCSERIGIVKGFKIYYCETNGCNSPCSGKEKQDYAEGSHVEEWQLKHLQPYTYYKVTISARTRAGDGEQSEALYEQTYESEPPYAADNIVVKEATNDSITFGWSAPTPTHGLIKSYRIEFNGRIKEIEVDPAQKNYTATLHNLAPFTNYTVYFQACVQQSKCSKKSDARIVSTDLGPPGRMGRPQITPVNSTHVMVTFENPVHPNGNLDYYNIMVMWENKDGVNMSRVVNVTSTDHTLELNCEDRERDPVAYSFAVQAVNILENETLFGPYSDVQEYPCFLNEGISAGIMAGVIGAAVGVTILVILIAYCYMRFRQKFREIQNIKIYLPPGLEPDNPKSPSDFSNFIPPPHKHTPINSKDLFNHLNSHSNGSPRSRNTSGDTRVSASSMDELLQNNGDNRTEVSADSGSAMGSVSSAKTTRSNLSSDSGNDIDSLPPTTPDMVFLENPIVSTAIVPNVPPTIMEKTPESSTPSPYSKFARYSNPPQVDNDGYLPTVGRTNPPDDSGYVLPSARDHSDEPSVLPYSQVGVAVDVGYVNVPSEPEAVQGLGNDLNAVVPLAPAYSRLGLSDVADGEDIPSSQPLTGYSAVGLGHPTPQARNAVANGYVTAAMAGDLYGAERLNSNPPALRVQAAPQSPSREKELPDSKHTSAATMDSPLPESYSRLSFHDPTLDNGYVPLPGSDQQQQPCSSSEMSKLAAKPEESNHEPSTSKSGYSPSSAINGKPAAMTSKNGYVSLNVANDSDASSPTCSIPHDIMKSSQTSDDFSSPGPYSRVVSMSFDDSDSLPSPKDSKS